MRKTTALVSLLFLYVFSFSQQLTLEFESGVGTYSMSEMSEIFSKATSDNELNPVISSNFPAFFFYRPGFGIKTNRNQAGVSFGIYSTGARSSIRDFSGAFKMDILARGYAPIIFDEYQILKKKSLSTGIRLNLGAIYSTIKTNDFLKVGEQIIVDQNNEYVSLQFFVIPEIKLNYSLGKNMATTFGVGYHIGITPSPISNKPDSWIDYLKYADPEYNETSWNGFRVSIGLKYSFKL
jgi:hypothetical protein